jgi:chromosome partitioning protein
MTISNKFHLVEPKMPISKAAEFLGMSKQAIHKKLRSKGIICPKMGKNSYINFEIARSLFSCHFKKTRIAVELVKGGTGKTTTVDNIGACANTYGARVLEIDADPQGNLTDTKGIDADELPVLIDVLNNDATIEEAIIHVSPGLDIVPSRIENVILDNKIILDKMPLDRLFTNLLSSVIDNYDLIIIDLPPTLGTVVTAATLFSEMVIAPLNPDKFSTKGLKILQEEIKKLEKHYQKTINYKCFLNKYSGNTILSGKAYDLLMSPEMQGKVLQTAVRHAQEVPNLSDINKNLFTSIKNSFTKKDFDQLTREILNIIPTIKTNNV